MKRIIKLFLAIILSIGLFVGLKNVSNAENPFITKTVNRFNELVETQDAYESVLKLKNLGDYTFNKPSDIFIDQEDYIYIADTNNKQIVILDPEYNVINFFGSTELISPRGVYVRNNVIYVADYGASDIVNGKVVLYNLDRDTYTVSLKEIRECPESEVLRLSNFKYRPEKISVDTNLTMYVVVEGSYSGVLTINDNNKFISYFAPNNVTVDLKTRITRFLYGDNEKVLLRDVLPTPPYNVHIDDSGYIYTVTQTIVQNDLGDTLKKVNIGGLNFYPVEMLAASNFVSCWSGKYGNVYAATKNGFIYEYDIEGNILFIFGGKIVDMDQLGLFESAAGIAVNSNDELLILDQNNNSIQVFRPTSFTNTLHQALGLFNEGRYEESQSLFEQVLVYNSMSDIAHKGIGLAHFMKGSYKEALAEFKLANDKKNYSEAYWEIRNVWISTNILPIFIVIMLIIITIFALSIINRKKKLSIAFSSVMAKANEKKWIKDGLLMFKIIRHPLDAAYYFKTDKKLRYYNGLIVLVLVFFIYILGLTSTGFIFNNVVLERTILLKEAFKILIPIILFVLANYLSSSLLEGEGTFKAIFLSTMACFMPIIVIYPILILVSNFLTFSESFIYYFGLFIMIAWSLTLLLVVNKNIHNYTFKKMILNILMTLLLMLVLLIVAILCYLMVSQVVLFIKDIIQEVIFNG